MNYIRGILFCICVMPGFAHAMYHRAVGRTDGTVYHDVHFNDDATQDDKDSALLQGARDNILEMVEAALQSGANPRARDEHKKSALAYAREHDNLFIIRLIVAKKRQRKQANS